jgi:hypothetical protein
MMRPRICAFRRSASPYFSGGKPVGLACAKLGRDASRERVGFPLPLRERTDRAQRDQVRAEHAPRPRALTRRAAPPSPARGEGKIARAARAENFHCNEKPASENVWTSRKLLRRFEACAPSTTPLGWSASPAVAVAEEHCACVARTNSITRPGPRTRHAIVRRLGGLAPRFAVRARSARPLPSSVVSSIKICNRFRRTDTCGTLRARMN